MASPRLTSLTMLVSVRVLDSVTSATRVQCLLPLCLYVYQLLVALPSHIGFTSSYTLAGCGNEKLERESSECSALGFFRSHDWFGNVIFWEPLIATPNTQYYDDTHYFFKTDSFLDSWVLSDKFIWSTHNQLIISHFRRNSNHHLSCRIVYHLPWSIRPANKQAIQLSASIGSPGGGFMTGSWKVLGLVLFASKNPSECYYFPMSSICIQVSQRIIIVFHGISF